MKAGDSGIIGQVVSTVEILKILGRIEERERGM
jgi:hypothetical protein